MHVLTASNLAKSYRGHQVVKDVSITVASGQVVGLLGPNGAGKTTCFYMIVGSISHDRGEVNIDDEDITHMAVHERARKGIGYLPQEASVFRKLTAEQNLLAILETRTDLDHQAQIETANKLMNEFRITHIKDTLGLSLSGGERRRVEIARALTTDPDFIILDEPFANLDPTTQIRLKKILKDLTTKSQATVLISSHDLGHVTEVCDRIVVLEKGAVVRDIKTSEQTLNELETYFSE